MRDLRTEGSARTARWGISALIACVGVTLIAGPSLAIAPSPDGSTHAEVSAPLASYQAGAKIPPRIQWNANFGYCGEVSFISAGLYYGQYLSQYDARAIASNNAPQSIASSQLLLGVNDVSAAKSMHLTTSAFNTAAQTNTTSFLTWVKANVKAGHPVAIGVFANQRRFYGSTNPVAGDSDYDHIVVVTGIGSDQSLSGPAAYRSTDIITFHDHGQWTDSPSGRPHNTFSYPFGTFIATRQQANFRTANVYSLKNGANFGIAFTGIIDRSHETVPVRLSTSVNAELPAIAANASVRPAAKSVTLTITVSGLKPHIVYNLYRYTRMSAVPDSTINAKAAKAARKWTFTISSGSTYTTKQTIRSNEIAVYRAVPAGAP